MYTIEELKSDVCELRALCEQATGTRVKDILCIEIRKLETEIAHRLAKEAESESAIQKTPKPVVKSSPVLTTKKIDTYCWDESDKFFKIYVTAEGVQKIDEDNVTSEFGERSFTLRIRELGGKNYHLEITNLHDHIIPVNSYHKIKSDTVLLMLRKKETGTTWKEVTRKVAKKQDLAPKMDKDKDPSDGLMDMMKTMYDEGDDEMKRTINKAWSESRNKKDAAVDDL